MTTEYSPRGLSLIWRVVHWIIIVNLAVQIGYGAWMVFVQLAPEGMQGPLMGAATAMPFEEMMVRRAYAMETWIAIGALSIYLGVTEIVPRKFASP